MNELSGMMGGFGNLFVDPIVLTFLGIIGIASIYIYAGYRSMPNNPYLIDSLVKRFMFNFVKKKYRIVTTTYLRIGHNGSIIVQAIRRELSGNKGLYLEYLDTVVSPPSEYYITGGGEDDMLYYVITSTGNGYPIKLELLKEEQDIEKLDMKSPQLVALFASKKKHDLFTSQHFKSLAEGIKTRVGRGKTQMDRLMESGVPAIAILGLLISFILIYNFAMTGQSDLANNVNAYREDSFLIQKNFMERDRYCQVFISRYGTQTELDKYLSFPTGFEQLGEDT